MKRFSLIKMRGLSFKIGLMVLVLLVIGVGTITMVSIREQTKTITAELIKKNKQVATHLASSAKNAFWSLNWLFVERQMKEGIESEDVIFLAIMKPNKEIYMSSGDKDYGEYLSSNKLVSPERQIVKDMVLSKSGEITKLIITPIKIGNEQWSLIMILSLKQIENARKAILKNSIGYGSIIFILGMLISFFFSRGMYKRISKLMQGIEEIAKGNLAYKISEMGNDEIGNLATAFNAMTEDLEKTTTSRDLLVKEMAERKRAEEEKGKLQNQLLQAQKMEAIGSLAGGVAHDFNNLLQAIQGYTDIALLSVKEDNPLYRDLNEIKKASARAANLTRQLLLFSRRQPIDFIPLNLNTTVDNLLKMLNRLIGEDISINTELDPELLGVLADAGTIEQVIMNLTVNARDAMPEGGEITIKTENVNIDDNYCKTYTYARPGKFICLTVEDTGIGMDKETIQHIFEPFFSTKGTGKGTGLGLSVVYGILKQHNGWINVYSEPGHGASMKFYLPAFSLKPEEEIKETISLESLKGSGERILLVEDEEEVSKLAIRMLGDNGYVIYDAANAEEALNIFDKEAGNFDLIFSDVILPGKTGLQLVDQLLFQKPELRVLLSSGYTDHKSQWPVIREKGFRFLQKPYGLTDLLRAIKEAIRQDK